MKQLCVLLATILSLSAFAQTDTSNNVNDTTKVEEIEKGETLMDIKSSAETLQTESRKLEKTVVLRESKAMIPASSGAVYYPNGNVTNNANYSWSNNSGMYNQQNNPAYDRTKIDKLNNGFDIPNDDMNDYSSGQLTAAELSDFDKYELWQHIAKEDFELYSRLWEINPRNRYSLQVMTGEGRPAVDIPVQLRTREDKLVWSARTNNMGSAELWGLTEEGQRIIAIINGKPQTLKNPVLFEQGINRMTVQMECNVPIGVDISFIVDATGSMKDEIKYLQVELEDIIRKVTQNNPQLDFRTSSVFYRCTGNKYSFRHSDFASDVSVTSNFIKEQSAEEGGAELVDSALYVAVEQLNWSQEARARIAFLILDEPPGKDSLTRANMKRYMIRAAEKGIRIIPVVASANYGTEESLEYLMRCAALLTNSSYVFLTDDSGIGDPHAKPTVDEYVVEKLNKLMIRLIDECTYTPECYQDASETIDPDTLVVKEIINQVVVDSALLAFQDSIRAIRPDTVFADQPDTISNPVWDYPDIPVVEEIRIWPNPTWGDLTVEVKGEATEVYLADFSGKIIAKYPLNEQKLARFDISVNPAGTYMVQCLSKKKWLSGKVVLMR